MSCLCDTRFILLANPVDTLLSPALSEINNRDTCNTFKCLV